MFSNYFYYQFFSNYSTIYFIFQFVIINSKKSQERVADQCNPRHQMDGPPDRLQRYEKHNLNNHEIQTNKYNPNHVIKK